jgi:cytochrome c
MGQAWRATAKESLTKGPQIMMDFTISEFAGAALAFWNRTTKWLGIAGAGVGVAAIVAFVAVAMTPRNDNEQLARQTKAMVDKAASFLQENGAQKAFAAFNDKSNAEFHDGGLYVFVRTLDGNTIAHGAFPVMIGQTDLNTKDIDGKLYNKELVELAVSAGSGWVHYRWPNPADNRIENKSTFIKRVGDYIVCAGFYEE